MCLCLPRTFGDMCPIQELLPSGLSSHSVSACRGPRLGDRLPRPQEEENPGPARLAEPPPLSVTQLGKSQLSKCSLWDMQDTVGVPTLAGCHPRVQCSVWAGWHLPGEGGAMGVR